MFPLWQQNQLTKEFAMLYENYTASKQLKHLDTQIRAS
jgi:hypothetical protein